MSNLPRCGDQDVCHCSYTSTLVSASAPVSARAHQYREPSHQSVRVHHHRSLLVRQCASTPVSSRAHQYIARAHQSALAHQYTSLLLHQCRITPVSARAQQYTANSRIPDNAIAVCCKGANAKMPLLLPLILTHDGRRRQLFRNSLAASACCSLSPSESRIHSKSCLYAVQKSQAAHSIQ